MRLFEVDAKFIVKAENADEASGVLADKIHEGKLEINDYLNVSFSEAKLRKVLLGSEEIDIITGLLSTLSEQVDFYLSEACDNIIDDLNDLLAGRN